MSQKSTPVYTDLAIIYNEIMKDVDYEDWADYIDAIIQEHHIDAVSILELACGTGKVAMFLEELDCYDITATDFSESMLEIGQRVARFRNMSIKWEVVDFLDIQLKEKFDVVMALFDSVNYLLTEEEILKLLSNVEKVIEKDGIFIFDFTTAKHSEFVAEQLNDEGVTNDGFRFKRLSHYYPAKNLHINEFDIEKLDTDRVTVISRSREVHKQRIYEFGEMKSIINQSNFDILAAYEDFDLIDADENSERITMVLTCKTT